VDYAVFAAHLLGLALAPGGFRWLLAFQWPASTALAYLKPNDRGTNANYLFMLTAAVSGLVFAFRVTDALARSSPDPAATTLYGISLWLLGLSGMVAVGHYAYVLRTAFWDRRSPMFDHRTRIHDVIGQLKRQ
jgi:membrane-bound metal-dependent hydrolase YbcI (DUF457 family)